MAKSKTSHNVQTFPRSALKLLAPVGGQEQLEAAIHFGADEVYLSGERWSMRAKASNFSDRELEAVVRYAHASQVVVNVTINTLMFEDDITELPSYLEYLDSIGVDALIIGDLGAFSLAQTYAPHTHLHISTQASVANSEAALSYARMGAHRIVLAREMTLEQIAAMHKRLGDSVELEAFVHGALCMAVSGRCLLSAVMVGPDRSASCGNCTQPCRWTWKLTEQTRPDNPVDLEIDERGSYILSANDLCMIEHLDALADAGITTIKIEGRNKGAYYVAATTNAYRHVIDGDESAQWLGELEATSHRPYSTGFFFGNPTQNPGHVEYEQTRKLIAVVDEDTSEQAELQQTIQLEDTSEQAALQQQGGHTTQGYLTNVVCRNKFTLGEELVVLRPHDSIQTVAPRTLEKWDVHTKTWKPVDEMRANMELYRMMLPCPLSKGDMLCKATM